MENLKIFFLGKLFRLSLVVETAGQVLYYVLIDKIGSEKLVILQQLFQHRQLAGYVTRNNILKNELEPFRHVHLEEIIFPDQLPVHIVESLVKFHEFLFFVVLVREYVLLQVHLHEIQQLK